ncbi:UV DNA damage repair endonuclease UvsE [Paenibacillus nasutitermitis]|uniref:UV damage endonuclease UvsE n=1 Tax=Paenibacillus nasutitermitis TaxID=1652958 RepID=A0A916ZCT2_9BACL|nr:UV DNA damage repair endonuclease UvsE [Paenibacillus nasutitermitis]GGD87696.1 UV damage endonuclease UvsE [Paenibacillus nasutitermitis]
MIVRFGFVAMSLQLENASPSRTMTYANFSKLPDREAALRRLERIAEENIRTTLRLLRHSYAHDIMVYRMSSKLIPLATHEQLQDWSPWPALAEAFAAVGTFVKEKGMRVSLHPDHFCVLSTPRAEVLAKSEADLLYHLQMLEAMGLGEEAKCNIHVGGAYGDKLASAERFVKQFGGLPGKIRSRITLENDDKTFTVRETLEAAEAVGAPMVLDIHHHAVNDGNESEASVYGELWPRVLRTWNRMADVLPESGGVPAGQAGMASEGGQAVVAVLPPKIHASSPRSANDPRSHADFIEAGPLLRFLQETAGSTARLDVMLEAKGKDTALFKLMEDLSQLALQEPGIRIIDGASIEVN